MKYIFSFFAILLLISGCEDKQPINRLPICSITEPQEMNYFFEDDTITITVKAEDEDGSIAEVSLYIDGVQQSTLQNPPFEYQWVSPDKDTGRSEIRAAAIDNDGASAYAYAYVNIIEKGIITDPPIAAFSVSDTLVKKENIIRFEDQSLNNPTSWFWDFGDGFTSDQQNPNHGYFAQGSYTVTLIASSMFGADTISKEKLITVILEEPDDVCWGCDTIDTVTDIDGNVYNTLRFGSELWMAENLKTRHFNDGTPIPLAAEKSVWNNLTGPGYCWYDNDSATYHDPYGPLYNWYATDSEKLCPSGWHVSTEDDWYKLIVFLEAQDIAGGKLKESGTEHWLAPNTGASNSSRFTALPGGFRIPYDGSDFYGMGETGKYWQYDIRARENPSDVYISQMDYNSKELFIYGYTERGGMSVRCVKDRPEY